MSRYVDSTEQLVTEIIVRDIHESANFYQLLGFELLRDGNASGFMKTTEPPNMALQRTRRPRCRSGRSLCWLGSPLNARPLGDLRTGAYDAASLRKKY
jgi:hypothetical protein